MTPRPGLRSTPLPRCPGHRVSGSRRFRSDRPHTDLVSHLSSRSPADGSHHFLRISTRPCRALVPKHIQHLLHTAHHLAQLITSSPRSSSNTQLHISLIISTPSPPPPSHQRLATQLRYLAQIWLLRSHVDDQIHPPPPGLPTSGGLLPLNATRSCSLRGSG
jgi:hypothetical protein